MLLKDLTSFLATAQKSPKLGQPGSRPLIVILGPTAAGKTAISLSIAKSINAEIISTDSRQIYRQMDISNDAILPEEQDNVPHHMLRIADPDQTISLAEFVDQALEIIEDIYFRGHIPMLVGGTGLYISAIIDGYEIPRVAPNKKLRAQLQKEAEENGTECLHAKLAELDPEAAKNIHPNNLRYVIRAIEKAKGRTDQNPRGFLAPPSPKFNTFLIGVTRPREEIYDRINKRVHQQLERGLTDEVEKLIKKGYDESLPAMSSLGVKEMIPFVKGEMLLEKCIEILQRNTRRYAKRQITWLKRYHDVKWLSPDDVQNVVDRIADGYFERL